ncbi:MAG: hypothetical protein ACK5CO_06265 [Bacteroidota bacterium]
MKFLRSHPFLSFVLFVLAIDSILLYLQTTKSFSSGDVNMVYRRIDTPARFILNGFLGALLNFKFSGILTWLVIPASIYLGFKKKYFNTPAKKAMVFVFILSTLLIGAKGYFNFRYQLTLYPFACFFLVIALGIFMKDIFTGKEQRKIFLFIVFLLSINNGMFFLLTQQADNPVIRKKENGFIENLMSKRYAYVRAVAKDSKLRKDHNNIVKNSINFLNYIDTVGKKQIIRLPILSMVKPGSRMLINNLPIIYYQSKIFGIYYWCGDDLFYTSHGPENLFKNRSIDEAHAFIYDSLRCSYVFSTPSYNRYSTSFEKWLLQHAKPIAIDNNEYILYEIQAEKGNYPIDTLLARKKAVKNIIYTEYLINDSLHLIRIK